MSLFFFEEIFFFKAVISDIMTILAEVGQHAFYSAGAAAEVCSDNFNRAEPVLFDQLEQIFQAFFIGAVVHIQVIQIVF